VIIIRDIHEMQAWSREQKRAGRSVGFVPTMGYLHEGHISLVKIARARTQAVVVSIFVNPTQFGAGEDFERYPRDFERDAAMCREAGVDVVFCPDAAAMYPAGASTYVVEEALIRGLCGASRPGHFRGVTTVVAKLFNCVLPDVCVLGEKDAQQLRVLRRMTRDLNFPVEILPGPTVREADGLAMSSRNKYLSPAERADAVWLSRSLNAAQQALAEGERDAGRLLALVKEHLAHATSGVVEYVELLDDETLEPVSFVRTRALLAIAVKFPSARLIDNVVLTPRD
jgi:pantoate--beta-alanine ligase